MIKDVIYNPITNTFTVKNRDGNVGLANLMWHITGKCLLNCPYCFAHKNAEEFDINKIDNYINIFLKKGVQKIDLSGGEPLLYKQLPTVCKKLANANIYFTITTSAYVDDVALMWLANNSKMFSRIIFSINAPIKDIHEKLNSAKDSFDNIVTYSKKISKIYNNIRINTVVTKEIISNEIIQTFISLIKEIMPLEWCIIEQYNGNKETEDAYKTFVDKIKKSQIDNINIIYRTTNIYNDYYVLQPNGDIFIRNDPFNKINIEDLK
ncbi:MAG: radical SAM protein [Clostridia bacterium]|nr:radical SAM protein [Clostridia bacterium]